MATQVIFDKLTIDQQAQLVLEAELKSSGITGPVTDVNGVRKLTELKKTLSDDKGTISELNALLAKNPSAGNTTVAQADAALAKMNLGSASKVLESQLKLADPNIVISGSMTLNDISKIGAASTKKLESFVNDPTRDPFNHPPITNNTATVSTPIPTKIQTPSAEPSLVSQVAKGAAIGATLGLAVSGISKIFKQPAIDAKSNEQATKEDKAALEKQQADNRAKLRAEETAQPASTGKIVPILPAKDWRFRMSIAPTLQALYNTASTGDILSPLKATGGVIFPYTPQIQTGYRANYEPGDLVHTNYKNYFYKNSSVDDLTITAEFTAQDQVEAQYLLAVIHFFRSVTKMFYGQDKSPNAGTPPPLVFLSGLGAYQYDNHPVLISSFNYTLPNDVDYIRTTSTGGYSGPGATPSATKGGLTGLATTASKFGFSGVANMLSGVNRLMGAGLNKGGGITPGGITARAISNKVDTTYVPTKIQISITAYPIISRRDMSQNFSLEKYAKGTIYRGSQRGGSGIW